MDNDKIFSIRLNSVMIENGMKQVDLCGKTGIGKSAISQYLSGSFIPKNDKVYMLAKTLNVNPEWLLGYDVEKRPLPFVPVQVGTMHRIPVIGSVHCGYGGEAVEDFLGYDTADVKNPEEYRYFDVKGDSMETEIHDGNRALVHIQPDVESGQLAVVIINGDEGCLKKVIKQGDSIILQSFNPNYPPRIFSGEQLDELCIWGRVVKTQKTW